MHIAPAGAQWLAPWRGRVVSIHPQPLGRQATPRLEHGVGDVGDVYGEGVMALVVLAAGRPADVDAEGERAAHRQGGEMALDGEGVARRAVGRAVEDDAVGRRGGQAPCSGNVRGIGSAVDAVDAVKRNIFRTQTGIELLENMFEKSYSFPSHNTPEKL